MLHKRLRTLHVHFLVFTFMLSYIIIFMFKIFFQNRDVLITESVLKFGAYIF